MTAHARIVGWGKYLPERVMPNTELEGMVDTSDEWIRGRSAIGARRRRRWRDGRHPGPGRGARGASRRPGRPRRPGPDHRRNLHTRSLRLPLHRLPDPGGAGRRRAGAFDLSAACSGFVYGLVVGAQFIQTGASRRVLVIGSEVNLRILDWQDRGTCVLFGDGAGAVVLAASDAPGGLLGFELGADGSRAEALIVPAGGSRPGQPGDRRAAAALHPHGRAGGLSLLDADRARGGRADVCLGRHRAERDRPADPPPGQRADHPERRAGASTYKRARCS